MKSVCSAAGVAPTKVFPHNLRHLFARTFYQASRDVVKLADILGHSSVETTRIYLISTGEEHAQQLEQLRLVGIADKIKILSEWQESLKIRIVSK